MSRSFGVDVQHDKGLESEIYVRGKMNLPSRSKDFFHCTVSRNFSAQ